MSAIDLGAYDALGLAELVRKKEVSPLDLIDAAIARIEEVNPRLNAIVTRMYERAREEAQGRLPEGPFTGVPFLVKDLAQPVAGVRFTRGSRFFAEEIPRYEGTLIQRYRRAGLVLVAKTNTPELGLTPFTEPVLHGPTRSPWSTDHTSGGSSGGAGAAVGARMVPMAHGGDGGGSIRIPAACCGVFGLKPTRGRTPPGPDRGEGWMGLAVEHALTLSVRDSAALLDATCGYEPGAPYDAPTPSRPFLQEVGAPPGRLRIALCKAPPLPGNPHPDVLAAAEDVARLCESLGHQVEEATLPVSPSALAADFVVLVSVATALDLDEAERSTGRKPSSDTLETTTLLLAMLGRTIRATRFQQARLNIQALGFRMAQFFETYDLLLSPTLGLPPPRIGQLQPSEMERRLQELIVAARLSPILKLEPLVQAMAAKTFSFLPYTPLANVTGLPSASLPLFWNAQGLPIGVMLTGPFGEEATLLRVSAQLEEARPWHLRRPPVCAGG
ncbi:MAG: amidase [Myxococcales bacterium]|nr:amidase [Polyangiaceae bacterium]MDW8249964.1 amidase [Myxococcales bacterium]